MDGITKTALVIACAVCNPCLHDGAIGSRITLGGVDQGIPLIENHREHLVKVSINHALLPAMASDTQHRLPSSQQRADGGCGEAEST
ncbi:hypothetical protein [Rugosibacter aromaticivorans]|uniref:hypothetical protein n=1 Tax=Rugosibacter aromaticivorans TaxID=1565605 RepID=UPI0012125A80|nr:hypothetical protein [Rugosibacter aromaticivorans]TBR15859.1 MAG: hypothetical protein EPO43_02505 [Rugosibacter sp.]